MASRGFKLNQLIDIDEFSAEQRGQFFDMMLSKPDSQLGAVMQRNLVDKIDDMMRERKGRECVVLHELLSQKDQNRSIELYPEFNIVSKDDKNMVHGFAAAERKLQALLLLARVPKLEEVDDIGGQWSYWLTRGEKRVHSSCPILDVRDKQREMQRQSFLKSFRDNATTSDSVVTDAQYEMYNAFKNGVDKPNFVRCNNTFQDCNCRGYTKDGLRRGAEHAIALHSLYDFELDSVADAMIEKKTKFLHAAMLFAPEAIMIEEGPLPDVNGYYHRVQKNLGTRPERIMFGFHDDPSYNYIHTWSEYKKYLLGKSFVRRGHTFFFEPWQGRGDTMFFTLYRMTNVPRTGLFGEEYYRRLYIKRWAGMVIAPVFDIDEVTMKIKRKQLYVEKAFLDKCLDYVARLSDQQLTINNVKSFMSSNNWVLFINGAAIKNKQSMSPGDLQLLAQTILVKEKLSRPLMTEMRTRMAEQAAPVSGFCDLIVTTWRQKVWNGNLKRRVVRDLAKLFKLERGSETLETEDPIRYYEIWDYLTLFFSEEEEAVRSLPDINDAKNKSDKIRNEAKDAANNVIKTKYENFQSPIDELKTPLIRKSENIKGAKKDRSVCNLFVGWQRLFHPEGSFKVLTDKTEEVKSVAVTKPFVVEEAPKLISDDEAFLELDRLVDSCEGSDEDCVIDEFLAGLSVCNSFSSEASSSGTKSDGGEIAVGIIRPKSPPGFLRPLVRSEQVEKTVERADPEVSSIVAESRFPEKPLETGDFSIDARLEYIYYLKCLVRAQNNEILMMLRSYQKGIIRAGGRGYPNGLDVWDLKFKKWVIEPPILNHSKVFVPDLKSFENGILCGEIIDASWDKSALDIVANRAFEADYCFVCDQLFLCNERVILKNLLKLEVLPLDCKFKLVDGVPGCGKSTAIVESANPLFEVILSMGKEATEDLIARFSKKKFGINIKKRVRTVDAFLMHCSNGECIGETLHFDEALMAHAGMVFFCAQLAKAKLVVCQGDQKQIAYKPRVAQVNLKFLSLVGRFDEVEEKRLTYRCPIDVALSLDRFYTGKVVTKNNVLRSMTTKRISSKEQVTMEKGVQYLTFLQSEKKEIATMLALRKIEAAVNTVHEAQGKTFKKVILVRTKVTDDVLARGQEYRIVAISRHTQAMVYETVKDDEVSRLIAETSSLPKASLMRYFVTDAAL
ncbi:136K protein [Pepper ringspot virus]|nr:136K protein [Pepper ringspot virus]AAA47082.1 136K protein [Pepper ringspot virus]